MHKEIMTKEQADLLPFVAEFSSDFGLVGGTAIALHIGHRRSLDFDLFSRKKFGNQSLLNKITVYNQPDRIIVNNLGELTLVIRNIKLTFLHFPYGIVHSEKFGYKIKMPDLLTLAAMKAFALGQRAKWKDYVDLYFILRDHFSISKIAEKAEQIFSNSFNEKLFRGQLAYLKGVNYEEKVEYLPGFEVSDAIIKQKLIDFSLEQEKVGKKNLTKG